jgi:predicted dehydrogenase
VGNDVLPVDRRTFVKNAGKVVGGGLVAGFPSIISAQTVTNAIKVGLVGCGGRGTGAASQALHADDYTELTAIADIAQSQVDQCLQTLKAIDKVSNRVKVEQPNQFLGLDAYQKVIGSGVDVVLLATPPGFRPKHLAACIDANKNVFCEKPVATDAFGIRSVLDTSEKAKAKNLSLVAGFCWRYNNSVLLRHVLHQPREADAARQYQARRN